MHLTIHRGTKEIGGSCVELTTATTRLVLDLGLPLVDAHREPFDSRAALRKSVETLKAVKVIPQIAGLFDTDSAAPDGILLSHAHLDHAGLLHLSRASVPIYATSGTSKMMLAAAVFAGQQQLDPGRFREVIGGNTLAIGDCQVTPLAVDHSIYGSVAFLIEAEGKTVLYSGDFRNHGRKPGMIRDLLDHLKTKVASTRAGAVWTSSTMRSSSWYSVIPWSLSDPKCVPSQMSTSTVFSALDVDRIVTLYRAGQKTGRIFVVDAYTAFVLYLIGRQARVPKPCKEAGIRVFYNQLFERRKIERIREKFLADQIELKEILAAPTKHLMIFRPSMRDFDFRGTLPAKCRCLYGYWAGYLKRSDWIDLQTHIAEVEGDFVKAHVSGHAYVADIISFVKSVNPKSVIPIHTFEPGMFGKHFTNVLLLSDGQTYTFGSQAIGSTACDP